MKQYTERPAGFELKIVFLECVQELWTGTVEAKGTIGKTGLEATQKDS